MPSIVRHATIMHNANDLTGSSRALTGESQRKRNKPPPLDGDKGTPA